MSSPNFMHKNSCNCPANPATNPCYVWFHYPTSPGKIYRFANIKSAYKFAHDETIDHLSIPTLVDGSGKTSVDYNPNHLYNNGQIVCDVDWHNYLCDILTEVDGSPSDKIWNVSAGDDIQVGLGLGSVLPLSISSKFCTVDPIYVTNQ